MLILVAIGLLMVDQASKFAVRSCMSVGETLPVFRGVFDITYVQNRGAAFSLFQNSQLVTIIFPIIIMCLGFAVLFKFNKSGDYLGKWGTLLIIAGGIGNLIDRIVLGFVTDMIGVFSFPVFNVADICVTCGCGILIIWVFLGEQINKRIDDRKAIKSAKNR